MTTTSIRFDSAKITHSHLFGLGLGSAMATAEDIADFDAEMNGPTDADFDAMAVESFTAELIESGYGECSLLDLSTRMEESFNRREAAAVAVYGVEAKAPAFRAFADHFAAIVAAAEAKAAPVVEPTRFTVAEWKKAKAARKAGYVTPTWTPSRVATAADMADRTTGPLARRYA